MKHLIIILLVIIVVFYSYNIFERFTTKKCSPWCIDYAKKYKNAKLYCSDSKFITLGRRKVHYSIPHTKIPKKGFPIIILFHGSGMRSWYPFCGSNSFNKYGIGNLAQTVQELIKKRADEKWEKEKKKINDKRIQTLNKKN